MCLVYSSDRCTLPVSFTVCLTYFPTVSRRKVGSDAVFCICGTGVNKLRNELDFKNAFTATAVAEKINMAVFKSICLFIH